nr:MAG TPA: hypothetical protein [Caudoviricetes sp.]
MTINYSDKTKAAIQTMHNAVDAAEQARIAGKAYAGKGELLDTAKEACNDANKAIITDAIGHFITIVERSKVEFIAAYFKDWTVDGFKVVQDSPDDGSTIHTDGKTLRVPFSAIDTAAASKNIKLASNGAWRQYMQIYGDNVFAYIADNGKKEHALSVKTALSPALLERRKKAGGDWLKHSHSGLVQQLNMLVKMVFPEELQPKFNMVTVDQKVVTASIAKAKRIDGNEAATLQLANIKTLEAILFTEIYTRMNNLAVNLETGLEEKKHADKKAPKAGDAKGGDVKDGNPKLKTEPKSEPKPKTEPKSKGKKKGTESAKETGKPVPAEDTTAA